MDIDISSYSLVGGIRDKLDALGIPYTEFVISAPEGTTQGKDNYGKVYTLPGGTLVRLISNPTNMVWIEEG